MQETAYFKQQWKGGKDNGRRGTYRREERGKYLDRVVTHFNSNLHILYTFLIDCCPPQALKRQDRL